jgi:hypothetical protein
MDGMGLWIVLGAVALLVVAVVIAMSRKPKDEEIVLPHRPDQPRPKKTTKPK